jgi:hypothetical protein
MDRWNFVICFINVGKTHTKYKMPMEPTEKTAIESDTPVMSTATKMTQLELLLQIEQYTKYKMMQFGHYRKLISGPSPALRKEYIEQIFPELVDFPPAEGVKMEVEDGE